MCSCGGSSSCECQGCIMTTQNMQQVCIALQESTCKHTKVIMPADRICASCASPCLRDLRGASSSHKLKTGRFRIQAIKRVQALAGLDIRVPAQHEVARYEPVGEGGEAMANVEIFCVYEGLKIPLGVLQRPTKAGAYHPPRAVAAVQSAPQQLVPWSSHLVQADLFVSKNLNSPQLGGTLAESSWLLHSIATYRHS